MKLKKYLKEIITTLFIISLTTTWYAVVTGVSGWTPLTADLWNNMKTIVDSNETKLTNISSVGGNIGIWNLNPSEKVVIWTDIWDLTGWLWMVLWDISWNASVFVAKDTNNWWRISLQWDKLALQHNQNWVLNNLYMYNNNVGIWTTNPTEKLDVAWTVKATAFDIGYEIVTNSLYKSAWSTSYSVDVVCPIGKKVISGGCYSSRANYENWNIYRNHPIGDNSWRCSSHSYSTSDLTLTVYAICANVQ